MDRDEFEEEYGVEAECVDCVHYSGGVCLLEEDDVECEFLSR